MQTEKIEPTTPTRNHQKLDMKKWAKLIEAWDKQEALIGRSILNKMRGITLGKIRQLPENTKKIHHITSCFIYSIASINKVT